MANLQEVNIPTYGGEININLSNIPVLDIGNRVGHTKYIDFLKWDEVTSPIMKGIDCFDRPFIVIKLIINNKKYMETYFQRFKESSRWQCCGHATYLIIDTGGGMNYYQANYVKSLINTGKVVIDEMYKPVSDYYIGKTINVYDEKKWNSAIIIQRQFRKCRYNPEYKMCESIQLRCINDIYDEYNKILI